ncbi:MAG: class I SAM-dependent methyltransferase [Candidatus Omnitrophica bacterium]|nr:class I SAM-dependent methyltransferase [Candidatus Omnitrophota bacterium]
MKYTVKVILRGVKRRILTLFQDKKKIKEEHALKHWINRKTVEGTLKNAHYEQFFTVHFGLDRTFYNGKKILDIGCGPRGSLEWADMAGERVGLDPYSASYHELGADCHKMKYVAAPAEQIPFPDGHFDVVSSFNSLDHVDDLDKAVKEIIRIIVPGGLFLLLTEIRMYSTVCEPQIFGWDIVDDFLPGLKLIDQRHYEQSAGGMHESILADIPYDHTVEHHKGILSAKFIKSGVRA